MGITIERLDGWVVGLQSCSIHKREIILEIVCFVVIFKSNMLKYSDSSASLP